MAKGGLGEWTVGGSPWVLPHNHLYIGCCHQGSATPEPVELVEYWAAALNMEGVAEFEYLWERPERQSVLVSNPVRMSAAFQKLATRFLAKDEGDPLFLKSALLELFAVARSEFKQTGEEIARRPESVTRALDWMESHFHEPGITLEEVAQAAGLSIHHFNRTFSAAMGGSAMRYLRGLRIRHSYGLLQGTALRVNEIANAVGFSDPLHFSRVFHNATGKSPREFRR
jgi:AraC-like DNA-binding protein